MTALMAIALAAAAVAITALWLLMGERRAAGQGAALVAATESPTVLTTLDGTVLAANAAMRALAPGARSLAGVSAAAFGRADEALLYVLARDARRTGCAHAALPGGSEVTRPHLFVRSVDAGRLAWTLLETGELAASHLQQAGEQPYSDAPFAHLRVGAEGSVTANRTFHRLFGSDTHAILAQIDEAQAREDDRVLLTTLEGQSRVCRHFPARDARDGARDVFLFPVGEVGQARGTPMRLLESVPAAIMQLELTGCVFWCNARATAVLGSSARPGEGIGDLVVPLARPMEAVVAEAAQEGAGPVTEMVQLRGAEAYLEITLTRVTLYGRDTLLAVLADASEVRRLEDQFTQSQKMEAVGKLAGGVAHDFNNVLTAIIGHCDLLLLRKEAGDPDYADLMQIVQNANRAAALVRQLLAFSRKQTLEPETLSLRDVIGDAHYLLDRLVGETVHLELEIGADLWKVRADPQQIEQTLMNLVVNARDAMAGGGTVTIFVANRMLKDGDAAVVRGVPPGPHVAIGVRDTGPGIPPAIGDKIFDPFFTTKAKEEGTGLGLSTVYGVVRQSGGHILAGNADGGGAEFVIYLPRVSVEEGPAETGGPDAAHAGGQRDMTGSAAVLLVEDEGPVRAFAARALTLRGYEVTTAETAEDAMEILSDPAHRVDLLISDVVMPGMSGPAFAAEARKLHPGLRLVFVSGYAEESFGDALIESDFLFLPKPFTLNQLTAKVKEALAEPG